MNAPEAKVEATDFISPASFWLPEAIVESAWHEHAPFAFWLMDVHRPRIFVELGSHHGFSYLAFCQAAERLGFEAKGYAIDTWQGDEHAGFYGNEVYERLRDYHEPRYGHFSRLVRSTFDDALEHFSDGSIDLLHIDGRHFYDDVKHDFESWKSKLSDRAVVLFHDTNVRERGFGVFRLWEQLQVEHPSFEFLHGHGLGVLGVGEKLPESLEKLFASSLVPALSAAICEAYVCLGTAVKDRYRLSRSREAQNSAVWGVNKRDEQVNKLKAEISAWQARVEEHERSAEKARARVAALENDVSNAQARRVEIEEIAQKGSARIATLESELSVQQMHVNQLEQTTEERAAHIVALESELSAANRRTKELEYKIGSSRWIFSEAARKIVHAPRDISRRMRQRRRKKRDAKRNCKIISAKPSRSIELDFVDQEAKSCKYFKPKKSNDAFESWKIFNSSNINRHTAIQASIKLLNRSGVKFSIIVPIYDPPINILDESISSVLQQNYPNWELILVDDFSKNDEIRERLQHYQSLDRRIQVVLRSENGHISAATNSGVDQATGEFLVFLDNDDKLEKDALALFALYISDNPDTDIIYSDDAKINSEGHGLFNPKFKPDWSPELLLSYCYISHLKALRTTLYSEIGGSRLGFEGSQDHDMLLRASERARHIGHIPQILYHRRVLATSTASSGHAKPYSFEAGRRAVKEAFNRRQVPCQVVHPDWAKRAGVGIYVPVMPDIGPSVALLIPTKNNWRVLEKLVSSLRKTTYRNFRCYVIDNESDDPETLRYLSRIDAEVIRIANPSDTFNFAFINNEAVRRVREEYVLFLNDDVEVINPRWLSQMVGWSRLEGVGAVGARLLYPDGRVQHGGVAFGLRCGFTTFRGIGREEPGYLWYAKVTRNTAAVTAAAMITPRNLFLEMGGFDDKRFAVAYNDVNYCARLNDAGYRIVYCGEAELYHHESFTRNKRDTLSEVALARTLYINRKDPYYGPHFSKDDNKYSIKPTVVPPVKRHDPVKLLAVSHNLNHEGASNSAFELISGLVERGCIKATVVSPQDGPLRKSYEDAGIDLRILERPRPLEMLASERDYDNRILTFITNAKLAEHDCLYANTATTFWAVEAAARTGIPSVWNIRESESWKTYYDWLPTSIGTRALSAFSYPYRVVFVANATFRRWSALDQLGNFDVIHNGLNLKRLSNGHIGRQNARAALGLPQEKTLILSLGTVTPRKGQHDLLYAYLQLPERIVKTTSLYFVGARPSKYLETLLEITKGAPTPWSNSIHFIDETGDTSNYWDAADIFVCTSRMESYPRVILEAMANKLAIITTPVFGIHEQVQENINALFYKPGNIEELIKNLLTLVQNTEYRKHLACNSGKVLDTLESYSSMLERYDEIFQAAAMSSVPRHFLQKNSFSKFSIT